MRRRIFIAGLGCVLTVRTVSTHAQQGERMRRIGVLTSLVADDRETKARNAVFVQSLRQLGWIDGQNIRIDFRGATNPDHVRQYAAELVALAPDVILSSGTAVTGPLVQATRTVPIVFVQVIDPVGAGFVSTLSRPGGNATGFSTQEYSMGGKWLELLKEIAPSVKRVAVIRDPSISAGPAQFAAIQAMAPSVGVELSPLSIGDGAEIEHSLSSYASGSNSGLIVTASASALAHRELITSMALRYKLPAIYFQRPFVTGGGLISYGPDVIDPYRRAAGYVDRILRGEKPADLPVQQATKVELVINLKTAQSRGSSARDAARARRRGNRIDWMMSAIGP